MVNLGIIAVLLLVVWWVMNGFTILLNRNRRGVDFYRLYNEQEDRTETMFDRRDKK